MSLVSLLSSQVGDRTQEANRAVVAQCLDSPALLADIAEALRGKDAALLGDCAEVMSKVAENRPDPVAPYADALAALLPHKTTRVRWEAMHALALVAAPAADRVLALLPVLGELLRRDASTIVRDYAVDALGGLAQAGEDAAVQAFPLLQEALMAAEGKHAGRALAALAQVARSAPALAPAIAQLARGYADHAKPVVRKAAKALLRAVQP